MDKVKQLRQKRVTRLKRRTINIGEYRKKKELIIISSKKSIRISNNCNIKWDIVNCKISETLERLEKILDSMVELSTISKPSLSSFLVKYKNYLYKQLDRYPYQNCVKYVKVDSLNFHWIYARSLM